MSEVVRKQQAVRERAGGPAGAMWLVQAITGLLLVPLLLLHMVAHHFVVEGGLRNYEEVIAYISNPAIFVITIFFLVVVTVHAMLGVRAILLDLNPNPAQKRVFNWMVTLVTVILIVYGIWLEVSIVSQ